MNYLDRIKQIDEQKIFASAPENELTKPPKAPSVSSVSTPQGLLGKLQTEKVRAEQAANDDGVTSFIWLMHIIDRDPIAIAFSPAVTHAGALVRYPDAVAAEPIEFLPESAEPPVTTPDYPDDRRTCKQCANLCGGVCTIARSGGVVSAMKGYRPGEIFRKRMHRCEGFAERTNDANHRG